jgi:beta-phosphoglucomutase-like phosphatase (HAD superfamily)
MYFVNLHKILNLFIMKFPNATVEKYLSENNFASWTPKAVFFDMDGVIFDSMPRHAKAWSEAMALEGLPFSEYQVYLQEGRTGSGTVTDVFLAHGRGVPSEDDIKRIYANKSRIFDSFGDPIPMRGMAEVLEKVKSLGLEIYIVTGSGQASLLDTLNHYFPNTFCKEKMVTAYDVKKGKPDPEPYLMALEKAGLQPNEAMVVENAPLGVRSAKGAGIFTVAVNTGILSDDDLWQAGADVVLADMAALLTQFLI